MTDKPILPTDSALRKDTPICTGVLDYFPRALAYIARISVLGNDKHNPGEPLHWAEGKSMDHPDCIARHLIERGTFDPDDGALHEGKLGWRALANLETSLKAREAAGLPLWDEEIVAKNKAILKEKLERKKAAADASIAEAQAVYREQQQRHPPGHDGRDLQQPRNGDPFNEPRVYR
jgi:hypothetical protein